MYTCTHTHIYLHAIYVIIRKSARAFVSYLRDPICLEKSLSAKDPLVMKKLRADVA